MLQFIQWLLTVDLSSFDMVFRLIADSIVRTDYALFFFVELLLIQSLRQIIREG